MRNHRATESGAVGRPVRRMSRVGKFFLFISSLAFAALLIGLLVIYGLYVDFSSDLPETSKLATYEPPVVTRLYADDGKLLAEYATEHRIYVPLDSIPKRVSNAFLAAEDKNFYRHQGVDFTSILRAAFTNLNNMGDRNKALVGGSTITQQVVKNFLLTNERSVERKVKEAILAFRISKGYSKNRILELYLNQIYLGNRSYGVASAALNYFNRPLDELSVAEAAFLGGLPKAPSTYNPALHYDRALVRRNYVLHEMRDDKFITEDEYQEAVKSPIVLRDRDTTDVVDAPFFAEEVRRDVASLYGKEALYEGGLFVKTTLNPEYQKYADAALRKALTQYDRRHGWHGAVTQLPSMDSWKEKLLALHNSVPVYAGQQLAVVEGVKPGSVSILLDDGGKGTIALDDMRWARKYISDRQVGPAVKSPRDVVAERDVLLVEVKKDSKNDPVSGEYHLLQIPKVNGGLVVMDPHTGKVLALAGGYSYLGSNFNRVTQARRQPGSAFKPFVYLAALENGYTPTSIIMDGPISLPQGAGLPNWSPQNYTDDYLGPTTLRRGVEKSRNAMTVRLASHLGINRIIEIGKRFGIYDNMPRQYSAVLGAVETTLLNLANAYAIIDNGGKRVTPQLIERIDDRYGKTLYRRDKRACDQCMAKNDSDEVLGNVPPVLPDSRESVVDPATDFQINFILQGVVQRGTAISARSLNMPLGGKTGTTNDSRDTWFVGFSPDLVVGLYVGFDQPRSLGKKETGSSVALPGFIDFMKHAMEGKPSRPFPMPAGIKLAKVDGLTGQPAYGDGPGVIYEAFKTDQDPTQQIMQSDNEAAEALPWQQGGAPDYSTRAPAPQPYGDAYSPSRDAHKYNNPVPEAAPPSTTTPPIYHAPEQPDYSSRPAPTNSQDSASPAERRQPRMQWRNPGSAGTGGLY